MPVTVTTSATEQSTYVLDVTFRDENEDLVVPNEVLWTLTDLSGTIVNARDQVSVSPASTVNIVLTGADLVLSDNENTSGKRLVTVEATYDSSLGNDLPLKEEIEFTVLNLTVIT